MPVLIDSHCHLDDGVLAEHLPGILAEAAAAGVAGYVVPGVHPDGWGGIADLAARHPEVVPAYGVHPMHAGLMTAEVLERLRALAPSGAAVGEIGLDPAYGDQAPMEVQEAAFRQQLRIAVSAGLPVLIHCRHTFEAVLTILREERAAQVGGIMHAYSGSLEMARAFIGLGFVIALSGTVTWVNAVKPVRIARELPLEHLVLESDAPDLTPQRFRGRFNRPAWVTETMQRVAELRGEPPEQIAAATTANVCRVLRLSELASAGTLR